MFLIGRWNTIPKNWIHFHIKQHNNRLIVPPLFFFVLFCLFLFHFLSWVLARTCKFWSSCWVQPALLFELTKNPILPSSPLSLYSNSSLHPAHKQKRKVPKLTNKVVHSLSTLLDLYKTYLVILGNSIIEARPWSYVIKLQYWGWRCQCSKCYVWVFQSKPCCQHWERERERDNINAHVRTQKY